MIERIFKGIWFVSLLGTMSVFFYVYASLPESVYLKEGLVAQTISRNGLFYLVLGILSFFSVIVLVFAKVFSDKPEFFRAWFYGLVTFLHIYIIVALQFLNIINSSERFNYASIGYIIYGSVGLVIVWAAIWPVYRIVQRFTSKQPVL